MKSMCAAMQRDVQHTVFTVLCNLVASVTSMRLKDTDSMSVSLNVCVCVCVLQCFVSEHVCPMIRSEPSRSEPIAGSFPSLECSFFCGCCVSAFLVSVNAAALQSVKYSLVCVKFLVCVKSR